MRPTKSGIDIFDALGHRHRRRILELIAVAGTLTVTAISRQFSESRQSVSKHIKVLVEAQLVEMTRIGNERHCRVNLNAFDEVREWVAFFDQFWDDKLSQLKRHVESDCS